MGAYFDVTLDFKYIQDEKSQEMLDIMFSNGRRELSRVYGWGGFAVETLIKGKPALETLAARLDGLITGSIGETMSFFTEK